MMMDPNGFDAIAREYCEMQRFKILQRRSLEHLTNMPRVSEGDCVADENHGAEGDTNGDGDDDGARGATGGNGDQVGANEDSDHVAINLVDGLAVVRLSAS
jgi:hypothetical protein